MDLTNDLSGRLKRLIKAYLIWWITSPGTLRFLRTLASLVGKGNELITFYHCMSDPHSFVTLQAVAVLLRKYHTAVVVSIVPEQANIDLVPYATTREQQFARRIHDAQILMNVYADLMTCIPKWNTYPNEATICLGERWAIQNLNNIVLTPGAASQELLDRAIQVSSFVLSNDKASLEKFCEMEGVSAIVEEGLGDYTVSRNSDIFRFHSGHLAGMLYYSFEWFWGIDRLHHLEALLLSEERLRRRSRRSRCDSLVARESRRASAPAALVGLDLNSSMTTFSRTCNLLYRDKPREVAQYCAAKSSKPIDLPPIEVYYSFRSPYSQIVIRPLLEMADFYGVKVRFKPVLTTGMCYANAPLQKQLYIARDARRESQRLEWLSYGFFNYPSVESVHHAFALYMEAQAQGREHDFLIAWSKHVWSRADDPHTYEGLKNVCRSTGIRWDPAILKNNQWRSLADQNLQGLRNHGSWGVPMLVFLDTAVWGQDRLFLIEQQIIISLAQRQKNSNLS